MIDVLIALAVPATFVLGLHAWGWWKRRHYTITLHLVDGTAVVLKPREAALVELDADGHFVSAQKIDE